MKVSLFTPTHDPQYLAAIYRELKEQPFDEWVILANGGNIDINQLAPEILTDNRVNLIFSDITGSVGALKKLACEQCTGDILVEMDHDDLLIAPGIQRIKEAFEDPKIVFAYSNCSQFMDGDVYHPPFDEKYGWIYKDDVIHNNRKYRHPICPSPHPSNVSIIHFAPDHFRSWRRDAYEQCGGHDPNLEILDDEDLMCKLFLLGEFKHINKLCYLYRVHLKNTWLQRNDEIQAKSLDARRKYLHLMSEAWSKRSNLLMLDLSNNIDKDSNYKSININQLNKIESNTVGFIKAFDSLGYAESKIQILNEIHRVLVPGGMFLSITPTSDNPSYLTKWDKDSFGFVTKRKFPLFGTTARFHINLLENFYPSNFHAQNNIPFVRAALVALKKDENGNELFRPHGLIEI